MDILNVLLIVLGMLRSPRSEVIIELIPAQVSSLASWCPTSGYDPYSQGRTAWSDLAKTPRTFSRHIRIHVPLKITPARIDVRGKHADKEVAIVSCFMPAEKRVALDLLGVAATAA